MDLDDFSHEMEKFADFLNTQTKVRIHHNTKFLLVEDGSVDFEQLEKYHIPYIVYREGSTPPKIIDIGDKK